MRCSLAVSAVVIAVSPLLAANPPLPHGLGALVREAVWKTEGDSPVLRGLQIGDRKIRDDDLAVLKKCPTLRGLDLQLLPITGKGLEHVAGLEDLQRLAVYKCFELKSADFAQLAKLKKLRSLSLSATELGDDSLQEICTLPELEYLNIGHTKVTEAGVAHIKNLKKLKVLVSWLPVISSERESELRRALPDLKFGDVTIMPDPIFRRQ